MARPTKMTKPSGSPLCHLESELKCGEISSIIMLDLHDVEKWLPAVHKQVSTRQQRQKSPSLVAMIKSVNAILHRYETHGVDASPALVAPGFAAPLCLPLDERPQTRSLLVSYKTISDELLPAMKASSHSANLIHRSRGNTNIVMHKLSASKRKHVIGGVTVRMFITPAGMLLMDILLIAVSQEASVRGRGHGTRLVNLAKALAQDLADACCCSSVVLFTQSDNRSPAWNFWLKQQFTHSETVTSIINLLWKAQRIHHYDDSTPCACVLDDKTRCLDPEPSPRAQALQIDPNASNDNTAKPLHALCVCGDTSITSKMVACHICKSVQHFRCVKPKTLEDYACQWCVKRNSHKCKPVANSANPDDEPENESRITFSPLHTRSYAQIKPLNRSSPLRHKPATKLSQLVRLPRSLFTTSPPSQAHISTPASAPADALAVTTPAKVSPSQLLTKPSPGVPATKPRRLNSSPRLLRSTSKVACLRSSSTRCLPALRTSRATLSRCKQTLLRSRQHPQAGSTPRKSAISPQSPVPQPESPLASRLRSRTTPTTLTTSKRHPPRTRKAYEREADEKIDSEYHSESDDTRSVDSALGIRSRPKRSPCHTQALLSKDYYIC